MVVDLDDLKFMVPPWLRKPPLGNLDEFGSSLEGVTCLCKNYSAFPQSGEYWQHAKDPCHQRFLQVGDMRGEALSLQCLAKAVRPVCEGCVCVRARRYFESRIFLYINVHYTIYIYRSIVCQLYTVCIQCTVYVFFFAGAMSLINTSSNMTAAKNAQL